MPQHLHKRAFLCTAKYLPVSQLSILPLFDSPTEFRARFLARFNEVMLVLTTTGEVLGSVDEREAKGPAKRDREASIFTPLGNLHKTSGMNLPRIAFLFTFRSLYLLFS